MHRITQEREFGSHGLWFAEEKKDDLWERVPFTMGSTAFESKQLLDERLKGYFS